MTAVEERVTYCRICEAACGMVATVRDGRVTKLRPDRDHPLSAGYACPKGIAMLQVHDDPDRVLHPLRRRPDGSGHDRVSWEEALDDIGARLRAVIAEHGPESVGWYLGNPGAFSYSHPVWVKGLLDALGSRHFYSANSQDVSNRFAASALLYGSPAIVPIPDLARTSLLVMIGANPLVSHGSLLTAPRIKDRLHEIVGRGGRVVVLDPRRTETARAFEHVAVRPDSDAWLLLSVLHVLWDEGLADEAALARQAVGAGWLQSAARPFSPEVTAERTGVPADELRALARAIGRARGAAVYGRTGSCLGRFGTLVAFLIDAVNVVTGNLDVPGGAVFGRPPVSLDDIAEGVGADTYGQQRSRVGGFPDVLGAMPASLMAQEITTPGDGGLRALFVSAGNPVLSVPDGPGLARSMGELDLSVSIDLYVTESNREADYVLPATTFLEREDMPATIMAFYAKPFVQWTEAVVEPAGEARQEWEIIDAIAARIGVVASSDPRVRRLGRLGVRLRPRRLADLLLRMGPHGLGRGGLSLRRVAAQPHGIVLADQMPTSILGLKLRHPDGRVRLDPAPVVAELARLSAAGEGDPAFPLRLVGLRELRSHNSWMHNAPKLMSGRREHVARVHPDDAAAAGVADGELGRVASKDGAIELPVRITDEVMAGTLAVPHGWGHAGGWAVANAAGGVNVNVLSGAAVADLEPLAGMAFLNGIPVALTRVEAPGEASRAASAPGAGPAG